MQQDIYQSIQRNNMNLLTSLNDSESKNQNIAF